MKLQIPEGMEIDGSMVTELHYYFDQPTLAKTKDEREFEWHDDGYSVEPSTPYILDGEWIEI